MNEWFNWQSALIPIFQWMALGGVLLLSVIFLMVRRNDQRLMRMLRENINQRERLATAIEQSAETIVVTDREGRIEYVNPAFERITGYTPDEAIGKTPRILKSGQHPDCFYRTMWQTLNRGDVWKGRLVNKRKDGTLYTEDASISPVRDVHGRIVNFVASKRDVTHELELMSHHQQAQKMESVGRLAGGVAHDFNNMLQAILGHAEIAMAVIEPDHPVRDDLQAIIVSARRSADLTRQLLGFARRQTIQPRVLDLNLVVSNTLKLLQQTIGEDIGVVWQPGADLWHVAMDPIQLDQILVSLYDNARDAIEKDGNGKIEIETRKVSLQAGDLKGGVQEPGDYVALSVRDNGCGMDAATLEHVFEPFFTTKKMGQGTGLGLATTYGIIRQNQGIIEVDSAPGKGTAFVVYLPRRDAPPDAPASEAPPVSAEVPASDKPVSILLVEDEPSALNVARAMLGKAGYRVWAAASPGEALRLAADKGDFDLLLTDVIMPEMNGADLAQRLQTEYPNLKCMFMSGYAANFLDRQDMIKDGLHFIQKPFSAAMLDAQIKAVLNER